MWILRKKVICSYWCQALTMPEQMKRVVENSSVYVGRVENQLVEQLSTWSGENGVECQASPSRRGFSQMPPWEAWRMGQDQRTISSQSPAFGTGQCQDRDVLFIFASNLI